VMKKLGNVVKSGMIKLVDIVHIVNSRFRDTTDVSDLMADLKVHGQLEPVAIRVEDNALIFGNRRVEAMKKLGWEEVRAEFHEGISDLQLLAMNISENNKRKNITPVEYGRAIWLMQYRDSKLTHAEIAAMISIPPSRITKLLKLYNVVSGTKYEKDVVRGHQSQGIPEEFVLACYNKLPRTRLSGKLSDKDWDILLEAAKNRTLTIAELSALRQICFAKPNIQMDLAIQLLKKNCKVINLWIAFDISVLHEEMKRNKFDSEIEFIKHLIREHNNKMLF